VSITLELMRRSTLPFWLQRLFLALHEGEPAALDERCLAALLSWLGLANTEDGRQLMDLVGAADADDSLLEQVFGLLDDWLFEDGALHLQRAGVSGLVPVEARRRRFRLLLSAYHPDRFAAHADYLTGCSQAIIAAYRAFKSEPEGHGPATGPGLASTGQAAASGSAHTPQAPDPAAARPARRPSWLQAMRRRWGNDRWFGHKLVAVLALLAFLPVLDLFLAPAPTLPPAFEAGSSTLATVEGETPVSPQSLQRPLQAGDGDGSSTAGPSWSGDLLAGEDTEVPAAAAAAAATEQTPPVFPDWPGAPGSAPGGQDRHTAQAVAMAPQASTSSPSPQAAEQALESSPAVASDTAGIGSDMAAVAPLPLDIAAVTPAPAVQEAEASAPDGEMSLPGSAAESGLATVAEMITPPAPSDSIPDLALATVPGDAPAPSLATEAPEAAVASTTIPAPASVVELAQQPEMPEPEPVAPEVSTVPSAPAESDTLPAAPMPAAEAVAVAVASVSADPVARPASIATSPATPPTPPEPSVPAAALPSAPSVPAPAQTGLATSAAALPPAQPAADVAAPADQAQTPVMADVAASDDLANRQDGLVRAYQRSIETGDLAALAALLAEDAQENEYIGRGALIEMYRSMFQRSQQRSLALVLRERWSESGSWVILADYQLLVRFPNQQQINSQGQVRYRIRDDATGLVIAKIEY